MKEQKAMIPWMFLMLTMVGVLSGCAIPAYIQYRVERAAATLPQPESVELLAQTIKNNSGSDCITFSYYWIYAPRAPLEEILARYRSSLLKAGWKELLIDKSTLPPKFQEMQLGVFQNRDYLLHIDRVNARDAVLFSGLYTQKSYLESKFREFGPLLMLSLSLSGPCSEAR